MQSARFVNSETRGTEAPGMESEGGHEIKLVHWRRDICKTRQKYRESDTDRESNRIEHEDLQSGASARGGIDYFRLTLAIFEHLVYSDADACVFVCMYVYAISNTVTIIARPPSAAKRSNEPSVCIFASYLRIAVVLILMHSARFTR